MQAFVFVVRRFARHPARVVTDFTMKAAIDYVVMLLWKMRRHLVGEQSVCSECRGTGWTPRGRCCDITVDHSRGPHQQSTEPSFTADQLAVWETVRHLPGVRIRQTPPPVDAAADQANTMPLITLATLFVILIAVILYPFV